MPFQRFCNALLALLCAFPVWAADRDQARHDLEQGVAAYQHGDFQDAMDALNRAIQTDPALKYAYAARAQVHYALGNMTAMREDLKSASPMSAGDAFGLTLRGTAQVLTKANEKAIADFNQAIEKDPHYAGAFLGRGRAYRAVGDFKRAAEDWTSALALDPKLVLALYDKADAEHQLGDDKQATADLISALNNNPKFPLAYSMLGMILAQNGDYKRAAAAYSKAITLDPKYSFPYLGRAAVQLHMGNKDDAMQDYAQAIHVSPDDYAPLYNRGEMLSRLGEKAAALDDFAKAAGLTVPDLSIAVQMADRLREGGRSGEAVSLYSNSLEMLRKQRDKSQNALYHDLLLIRARLYAVRGDNELAEKDLNEALLAFPRSAAAWVARGKFYLDAFKIPKAASDLEKALAIDPKYTPALIARGKLKASQGQTQEAIKDFSAILDQDPKSAEAYGNRGMMYVRLANNDAAFKDFSQAVALAPGDAQWHYELAIMQMRQRDFLAAIESLNKSLSLEPPSAKVLEQRAQAFAVLGNQEAALKDIHAAAGLDSQSAYPYILSSEIRLRAWEPAQALNDLDQAQKLNDKSFTLRFNLGIIYGIQEKYRKSANEFKQAVKIDPRSAPAYTALCRALRLNKDYSSAENACRKASELNPRYPLAYIDRGLALLALKDYEGAATNLLEGYHLGAHYAGAELARSIAHAAMRQYAESDAAYRSAMNLDSWTKQPQVGFEPRTSATKDYYTWMLSFKRQLQNDTEDPMTHLIFGNALSNANYFDQALGEYTKMMQTNGSSAVAYLDRCLTYQVRSQLDLAEEDCRHAVELEPHDEHARIQLLETLALRGEYRQGLEQVVDAIRAIPHSAALFAQAGNLRYYLKDIPRALENYKLALAADPELAEGHNGLGLCDLARKKNMAAIEDFSRAIFIDPRNAHYYANRAAAYVGLNGYANAATDYRSALAVNTNPEAEPPYKRRLDLSLSRATRQAFDHSQSR